MSLSVGFVRRTVRGIISLGGINASLVTVGLLGREARMGIETKRKIPTMSGSKMLLEGVRLSERPCK